MIKAEKKKRKDQGRNGLIISEAVDSSIDKVQPHSVSISILDSEWTALMLSFRFRSLRSTAE